MLQLRPPRIARLVALAALLVLAAGPTVAWAHGGQFRAPGAPPTGPGMGGVPVPQVITPGETWQTWWDLNRFAFLPGRDAALHRQVVTPGEGGSDTTSLEDGWAERRAIAAERQIVPFLLRLAQPEANHRPEVVAAALIALGKIGQNRIVHSVLVHWLHDAQAKDVVRESAALGIGLLRRTKPALQVSGEDLDVLRDHLLRALDDEDAHVRVRSFAAVALGLLADQPYGSAATQNGCAVVRALWQRLARLPAGLDLPIAIFTGLGLQPRAGVPDAVREGLRQIALGRTVHDRRWKDLERSHALDAVLRQGGDTAWALLLRVLRRSREPTELRRAAYLGVGRIAPELGREQRIELGEVLLQSLSSCRDSLSTGLGLLAAGRLLAADLADGKVDVIAAADPTTVLFQAAEGGSAGDRGFATIALALAAKGAQTSGLARPFLEKVRRLLHAGLAAGRGDDSVRAAYAAGLGVLEDETAVDALLDVVREDGNLPVLRGHAAVALGQIGSRANEVLPVLRQVLAERRGTLLRVRAALSAALLGDRDVKNQLLAELKEADTEYHRAHVVIALGRLGDLAVIPALIDHAGDEAQSELSRALGVVALGLVADPEPSPSLLKLTRDANYPSATSVLYSAYAIF